MREFEQSEGATSDGCEEFPVAFSQFAPSLVGTDDEIWTKWLQMKHGAEKHTPSGWLKLIDFHRGQPAYQQ